MLLRRNNGRREIGITTQLTKQYLIINKEIKMFGFLWRLFVLVFTLVSAIFITINVLIGLFIAECAVIVILIIALSKYLIGTN